MIDFDNTLPIVNLDELAQLHSTLFNELSPKEAECLYLLTSGFERDDVAKKMFISRGMVKKHILNIKINLGVTNTNAMKNTYNNRFHNYQQKELFEVKNRLDSIISLLQKPLLP